MVCIDYILFLLVFDDCEIAGNSKELLLEEEEDNEDEETMLLFNVDIVIYICMYIDLH